MKSVIAILLLVLGLAMTNMSQTPEFVTAAAGEQVVAKISKLTIKFISVVEDSRCPEGTNCIWAGNAKIKVSISNDSAANEFEMNTEMGPKGDSFGGYAIYLEELTPVPKADATIDPKSYKAKFKIVRLTR